MRIAIIGGGIAGALLALRLRQASGRVEPVVYTGSSADASGASGGLTRAFESDPEACRAAAESLAELRASATLRDWAGFREIGSLYLLPAGADPAGPVAVVDELLPGSAAVLDRERLRQAYPFRDFPGGTLGVAERHAGHIHPDRLRAAALRDPGISVRRTPVLAVSPKAEVRLPDGSAPGHDAVVVAAGAWTAGLLARSGLPAGGLRTKQIQYSVCAADIRGLGAFVDESTGFYGRPAGPGTFLLGLPGDRWDIDPDAVTPDADLIRRTVAHARDTFGVPVESIRTVASFDCYHDPAGLRLRPVAAGAPVFTFTGGSGGAAKTILATSRIAAAALLA
ncbi:FAD-dependent oxidoreductase [Actinoallomurus sp. NPDC050550]|uniref:FAD-dependent oxidoreductase n=1 Tax=Actinoallomurus sp. NPDC050550 TaxID=3154937 RepID=UPI0033FFF22C